MTIAHLYLTFLAGEDRWQCHSQSVRQSSFDFTMLAMTTIDYNDDNDYNYYNDYNKYNDNRDSDLDLDLVESDLVK